MPQTTRPSEEDHGPSEDDERLEDTSDVAAGGNPVEVVVGGDPVEESDEMLLSTKNDGGASIEPTCRGFNKPPGYAEDRLRTKLRMDMGGPFRRHPRPPGTPIPPRRKRATSSSQPVQRAGPLQLVSTSSSQPVVYSNMVGARDCAVPDSLYRALLHVQAPLVINVNCALRLLLSPNKPGSNRV